MNFVDLEILPPVGALVLSYLATIWRRGWRWVLAVAAVAAGMVWLLMLWADALNSQIWLGGLVAAISALMIGVGVVSGAVAQVIDTLRPNGGAFAFRAWGLAVVVAAGAAFLIFAE